MAEQLQKIFDAREWENDPTFAVYSSPGLYEIIANVLAAATVSISRYRLIGKGVTPITKWVVQERLLGVLLAIGIC